MIYLNSKLLIIFLLFSKISICKIIITAPHSHCLPKAEDRVCDKLAGKAAKLLAEALKTSTIFSTHYREGTDLNREESRPTQFRIEIGQELKKCRQERQNCILLDVHSFPKETYLTSIKRDCVKHYRTYLDKKEQVQSGKYQEEKEQTIEVQPKIFFIKSLYDENLGDYLFNYLKKFFIPSIIFEGNVYNDIIFEASFNRIPSVLIEFNESLTDQELEFLIKILVEAINSYIKGE